LSYEVVKHKVATALNRLRSQDSFLIEANTNERTISHKLAEYLQEEFPDWDVDCEYNRHMDDIKKVELPKNGASWNDTEARTVFPDIIVHKRNTDKSNLLVIEVKKASNPGSRQFDKNKLIALTKEPYRYRFGLFLEFSMNSKNDSLEWYVEGDPLDE
jgi:DNA-directed RNA polymerase specialized sigma54-like protein